MEIIPLADEQKAAAEQKRGNGCLGIVRTIAFLAGVIFMAVALIRALPESDAKIREAAELKVESDVYRKNGIIPDTESKIIYESGDDVCVGVNYDINTLEPDGVVDKNVVWGVRVVRVNKDMAIARSMTNDCWIDIDNPTKEDIAQLKALWELP